jgi:hypothetical protein
MTAVYLGHDHFPPQFLNSLTILTSTDRVADSVDKQRLLSRLALGGALSPVEIITSGDVNNTSPEWRLGALR